MLADGIGHILAVQIHMLQAVRAILQLDVQAVQQSGHRRLVLRVHSGPVGPQTYGPIDGPGIHIQKAQPAGQQLRQGGLSRPGGAVHGDALVLCHGLIPPMSCAAASPAAWPVDQAICRLKPPV